MAVILRHGQVALNEFVKIETALADGIARLDHASDSPRLDAEMLLARALDVPRSYLFAHPEDSLDPAALARFTEAVERRSGGMPMAYITGEREFWSLTLMVTPDTLVPRPETEVLVDHALQMLAEDSDLRVLDAGTGSGAIALAIASERPLCAIVATDIDDAALAVAAENARQLDIANVEFRCGDWFEPVADERFELIVVNPPYIPHDDAHLDRLSHEPRLALVAGEDGCDAIRRIARDAAAVLDEGGTLLLEHGDRQREAVTHILQSEGWRDIRHHDDLAGRPRVVIANR